jgi:hypothetical protein
MKLALPQRQTVSTEKKLAMFSRELDDAIAALPRSPYEFSDWFHSASWFSGCGDDEWATEASEDEADDEEEDWPD